MEASQCKYAAGEYFDQTVTNCDKIQCENCDTDVGLSDNLTSSLEELLAELTISGGWPWHIKPPPHHLILKWLEWFCFILLSVPVDRWLPSLPTIHIYVLPHFILLLILSSFCNIACNRGNCLTLLFPAVEDVVARIANIAHIYCLIVIVINLIVLILLDLCNEGNYPTQLSAAVERLLP